MVVRLMGMKDFGNGWVLHSWDHAPPMLFGPRNVCVELEQGDLVLTIDEGDCPTLRIHGRALWALRAAQSWYDTNHDD